MYLLYINQHCRIIEKIDKKQNSSIMLDIDIKNYDNFVSIIEIQKNGRKW